ncbi:WD repeat-containing protein 79, putative (WDR79) [Plasmodium ovale wallikeri]|uniref:WD repeat-containing protein 79, putative (WDR79) n=1 Tax=Plasmodium ovale wallikeri TaxID=864142 RepID=A0A1A8ZDF8_PLAOA|nr:WD repeat-containing protein 79, putative (WDR79) [Plasmodium ovale wallikeri]
MNLRWESLGHNGGKDIHPCMKLESDDLFWGSHIKRSGDTEHSCCASTAPRCITKRGRSNNLLICDTLLSVLKGEAVYAINFKYVKLGKEAHIRWMKQKGNHRTGGFYILQEIPYTDSYNYDYKLIDKFYQSGKDSYYVNGDSSSEAEPSDAENVSTGEKCVFNHGNSNRSQRECRFLRNECLKQCEFNRDGSCYYTLSSSNNVRLYATDPLALTFLENGKDNSSNLRSLHDQYVSMEEEEKWKRNNSWININMNEHVYDCKFYPHFEWNNVNTCFFGLSSKDKPVCLYSAFDGSHLISFKTLSECYELCNCYSLCFHPEKNWLLCGTNKSIKVFDIGVPNEPLENRILSTRKGKGQKGIISTIDYKKEGYGMNTLYAVGDYNDCLYLYADNCDHKNDYILKFDTKNKSNGITYIKWFNEFYILSGSRNGSYIYLYDMRNGKGYVQKYERYALTNQKYLFDTHHNYLLSGDTFGYINMYDIVTNKLIHRQLINKYSPIISVSAHPTHPLLLTGSGTRRFYENNNHQVDIITNLFYNQGGNNSNYDCVSQTENKHPFPVHSSYLNSACTVFFDFPHGS